MVRNLRTCAHKLGIDQFGLVLGQKFGLDCEYEFSLYGMLFNLLGLVLVLPENDTV